MLAIKLQRIGRKGQPSYRIVVAERRSKLGAPPVEDLGFYNSFSKAFEVKKDRLEHWLKIGAQATPTVHNLFVKHEVIKAPKIAILLKKKEHVAVPAASAEVSTPPVSAETPAAASPTEEVSV
ncbi:MAG: 30S ribosomal protein S16 [Patescibacteria group bacterium]